MSQDLYRTIVDSYSANHDRIISLVADLTNEQLLWRASDLAPSIGFHAWHLGRWADLVQEIFNGPGRRCGSKRRLLPCGVSLSQTSALQIQEWELMRIHLRAYLCRRRRLWWNTFVWPLQRLTMPLPLPLRDRFEV